MEFPELHDLAVREGGDLVKLDPLACAGLLVLGCGDISEQVVFLPCEGIGQQIIGALVFGHVLADMTEVQLDVDIVVLELGEVVLEITDGIEEVARTLLDGVGHGERLADVVAVGVEHEDDLLDLALLHQGDDIVGKGALVSDVLDAGHGHGHDAMLAGLLRLLLAFLYEERLQLLSGAVGLADSLGVIYESRRTHGAAVLDRSLVLIEVEFRILISDTQISPFDLFLAYLRGKGHGKSLEVVVLDDGVIAFLVDLSVLGEGSGDECAEGSDCTVVAFRHRGRHIGVGQSGLGEHPLAEVARL